MSALRMRAKGSLLLLLIFLFSGSLSFAQGTRDQDIYLFMDAQEKGLSKEKEWEKSFREAEMRKIIDNIREEQEESTPPIKPVFKINPYFNASLTYDDNIYQMHSNKIADWYSTLSLGANLFLGAELEYLRELSTRDNYYFSREGLREFDYGKSEYENPLPTLNFNLGTTMINYLENSSLDQKAFRNFNGGFVPDVNIEFKLGRGNRKLRIREAIKTNNESLSSIKVGSQGQVRYFSNKTNVDWEQTFNRLGYNLGFSRNATNYESSNKNNDYVDQKFITGVFLQAFPKTRFFVEADFGTGTYSETSVTDNDVKYWKMYLGVQGVLNRKTTGVVKFGFQDRSYKDGSRLNAPALEANLHYSYSPKTKFSLMLSRDSREGSYFADGFNKNFTVSFSESYAFNRRLTADLCFINYMHDEYQSGRRDDTYTSSVTLNYLFKKWMTVSLSFYHIDRKSNNLLAAYVNNKCSISAKLEF